MTRESATLELLCRLLAAFWEPAGASLSDCMPWPDVTEQALSLGLGPLLYAAIRKSDLVAPDDIQEILQQSYYQTAALNSLRLAELERILAALSSLGTRVLLLKGAALAETLYRNVALRPMSDLDLVVPQHRVPDCRDALFDLDYIPTEVEERPGSHLAYRSQQGFTHPDPLRPYVELHWHLIEVPYYMSTIPMDWFWENAVASQDATRTVRLLSPEANLVYLPAHLALHHRFRGLRWFVDLALLVHRNHENLDWDNVIAAAQEFELLLVLQETLDRLAGYWPSLPLDEPRKQLHALQPTPQERRLFRLLTAEPRSPLLDFYTDIVSLGSLPDQARFILLNAFPQPAYMAGRYGVKRNWELPYWYLYRLGDGAAKLVRTLPQALRLSSEHL